MKLFFILMALFSANFASAGVGGQEGNGGDICEDRFKIVRDDIQSWIIAGGAAGLTLPSTISPSQYTSGMLQAASTATISCTDDQIVIDGAEKTCKNFQNADGTLAVVCNNQRFLETAESDQYVLVHHEYAGLAGFEENDGSDSVYTISNQIAEYLENQTVKKLGVKPLPVGSDPFDPASCQGPMITQAEALTHFATGADKSTVTGSSVLLQRFRPCNTMTGCQDWTTRDPSFVELVNDHYNHPYFHPAVFPPSGTLGGIQFEVNNGAIELVFSSQDAGLTGTCGAISGAQMSCTRIDAGSSPVYYSVDDAFADFAWGNGDQLALSGVVTNSCLRLTSAYQGQVDTNGDYHDVETVWFSRF